MKRYLFAAVALGLSSCLAPGNTCKTTQLTPVESFSGPTTGAVNQPVTFKLNYTLLNGCGKFLDLTEQTGTLANGSSARLIGVRASYDGCVCTQATIPSQATYTFTPTQAGTYYVHFIADNTAGYLADTLVVK